MNQYSRLAVFASVVLASCASNAAVIYDNMPGNNYNTSVGWGIGNYGDGGLEYSMFFNGVDAGGDYVDSVSLALYATSTADGQFDDPYIVSIASVDGNGNPTDLYTWTNVIGNNGVQTLFTGSSVLLTSGTQYAIHVGHQDGGIFSGGWYMANTATDGFSYQYNGEGWNNFMDASSGALRVEGHSRVLTPEPITMSLGIAGIGLFVRRRRQVKS